MKRSVVAIIAVVAFILGAVVGVLGYVTVTGGSGEPSVDTSERAPQLSLDDFGSDSDDNGDDATEEDEVDATEEPEASTGAIDVMRRNRQINHTPLNYSVPQQQTDDADAETTPEPEAIDLSRGIFRIVPDESGVRFEIDEDLYGERITAVGTTQDVGGDIGVNFETPADSIVGTIIINARTLETDQFFRNQALRGQILRSAEDDYEFIEFTPTAIEGLPEDAISMSGETLTFDIIGDLTIIDTTNSVTFETTVLIESEERISGTASTVVQYPDFNLSIPSVPGVANVSDDVTLVIDFVAELAEGAAADSVDSAMDEADSDDADSDVETDADDASDDTGDTDTASDETASGDPITVERAIYRINQDESEVRFNIDEELRGQPETVVGTTNEVGGDIGVDFTNPAASLVGGLVINARTLTTDNEFRDRAIRSRILRSVEGAYEFIEFTPTAIEGLTDEPVTMTGTTLDFTIMGDLTIIESTNPVTFDVSVTVDSEDRISGSASTTILYPDFNLSIPSAPGVANVAEEVILEIDFVADRVESQ